ncbi:hypothetical protein CDD82_7012 [Ophiocordyceps australis]|uniref:Sodium/calcium exchanger membrane region domain-containing protein n=1 Tax=Ophiocordyceps australis TaxID=1399860 RepID=A0A2C5YSW8_9HYPO|nr:hypothetical protein CDD82_7012 [Ophiocordyceps australis]
MKKSHSDPPDIAAKRPGAIARLHGAFRHSTPDVPCLPTVEEPPTAAVANTSSNTSNNVTALPVILDEKELASNASTPFDRAFTASLAATSSLPQQRQGSVVEANTTTAATTTTTATATNQNTLDSGNGDQDNGNASPKAPKRGFFAEVRRTFWMVITYSWLNVLLVFVPIGIAVANIHGINGGIVFAMNCIAVIPLAGLLSHATESVAHNMGDSLGALLNVTFGNAVELIIFM